MNNNGLEGSIPDIFPASLRELYYFLLSPVYIPVDNFK